MADEYKKIVLEAFGMLVEEYKPERLRERLGGPINLRPHLDEQGVFSLEYLGALCNIFYRQDDKNPNKKYLVFKTAPPRGLEKEIFRLMKEFKPGLEKIQHYVRKQTLEMNGSGNIVGEWELKRVPEKAGDFSAFIKGYFLRLFFSALIKVQEKNF